MLLLGVLVRGCHEAILLYYFTPVHRSREGDQPVVLCRAGIGVGDDRLPKLRVRVDIGILGLCVPA